MPNPYDVVNANFTLPFQGYQFQQKVVNDTAPLQNTGLYQAVGTGKTFTSTCNILYKFAVGDVNAGIILMPPILIDGWLKFLSKIPEVKTLAYRGTPSQRMAMNLGATEFTLMSYDIFKRDYEHIVSKFRKRRIALNGDEATAVKNIETANHKAFHQFTEPDNHRLLLTGTPLSSPMDAYAYCKLVAPGVYKNFAQFKRIHVEKYDFYNKPEKFRELDLLAQNMTINSVRILKEDVLKELPPVTFQDVPYTLSRPHMDLYRRLAEEQLLTFEDGSKIDVTQANRLYHALQQVVINWDHFSGDPKAVPEGVVLIEQILEELGAQKLVVVTMYQMTNRQLLARLAHHGAVAIWGGNTATKNQQAIQRFIEDPKCRVMMIQPKSGGYGVDGLQDVCQDMLFLECPVIPAWVEQTVARLHRNGQKFNVHVRFAIAQGTMQPRMFKTLLHNDEQVNQVVRNARDLRAAIYGN